MSTCAGLIPTRRHSLCEAGMKIVYSQSPPTAGFIEAALATRSGKPPGNKVVPLSHHGIGH